MTTESQWKARAEWAEERLRFVAALLRIPDGARYQNDVREYAEIVAKTRIERDRYRTALEEIAVTDFFDGMDRFAGPNDIAREALA